MHNCPNGSHKKTGILLSESLPPHPKPLRPRAQASQPDVKAAVTYVWELIRREIARGVPAEKIVLGGFSQGGLIATRAALSFPDASLGGVLALSTFFGVDAASVADVNAGLKLLVAHGAEDPLVPLTEGQRLAERVQARLALGVEFLAP